MKLLHIDSSIFGQASVSRELSASIVNKFKTEYPDIEIFRLDVAETPLGHLTAANLPDLATMNNELLKADLLAGQNALQDFLAADVIVIGAPMYNFGIPSQLKAWIDRLAVAGVTFKYDTNGPVGLCTGKKVLITSSRGGVFSEGSPIAFLDHQEAYLKAFFSFLGITDVTIIRAEGLAYGDDSRAQAINDAKKQIASLQA